MQLCTVNHYFIQLDKQTNFIHTHTYTYTGHMDIISFELNSFHPFYHFHTNVWIVQGIHENWNNLFTYRAPKSREVDHALTLAKECIAEHKGPLPSVPLHLRNAPTRLMKDLGKFMNLFHLPQVEFGRACSWMVYLWMFQDMEKDITWHTKTYHSSLTCLKV